MRSSSRFVELIQETTREIYPKNKIDVIIKSTGKGSFLVDLNLTLDALQKFASLFKDQISIDRIIEVSFALILLKRFLKGKAPEKVEENEGKVTVYLNNSRITIVKDAYIIAKTNAKVDEAIAKMAKPIVEDEKIEGIELWKEKKPVVKIAKSEIPYLTATNPLLTEEKRIIRYERQIVHPIKVVFVPGRKWEFTWKEEKISAFIKDEAFYKRLGEFSFKEGTKMVVDLEIEQVFDHDIQSYVNREYFITKVHEVIDPPKLPSLF